MGDTISNNRNIDCGIPHVSILSPKLFILCINDICNIPEIYKFALFADDANIVFSKLIFYVNKSIVN